MSWFAILLGAMIVLLSAKPGIIRARRQLRDARAGIIDLKRRRQMLSQKLRALARESLDQRLTAGADGTECEHLNDRIAVMMRRVEELEAVDRRILVLDERRGLQESGWILLIRRPRSHAQPLEPVGVTRLWDEGRHLFVFASDMRKARRKAAVRFPQSAGFQIVEVHPHDGELSETPQIGAAAGAA